MMASGAASDAVIMASSTICSLGLDTANACAAARAGIRRSQGLDYFRVRSAFDGKTEMIAGHPAALVTSGFEGRARLLQLLSAGFASLKASIGDATLAEASIYLAVPDPLRTMSGLDLAEYEQVREKHLRDDAPRSAFPPSEQYGTTLTRTALQLAACAAQRSSIRTSDTGHTGVSDVLDLALHDLASGEVKAAVVGGVDSLLDEDTLQWLHNTGRLKTRARPDGLQPGEGCALLYLVDRRRVDLRDQIAPVIRAMRRGTEPNSLLSGGRPTGKGLADTIATVARLEPLDSSEVPWIITDQNGETYRAMEWGNSICRLTAFDSAFNRASVWYPAAALGETGTASGAVGICFAARAFQRGYAPSPRAVVTSSADGQQRAAILVSASLN